MKGALHGAGVGGVRVGEDAPLCSSGSQMEVMQAAGSRPAGTRTRGGGFHAVCNSCVGNKSRVIVVLLLVVDERRHTAGICVWCSGYSVG